MYHYFSPFLQSEVQNVVKDLIVQKFKRPKDLPKKLLVFIIENFLFFLPNRILKIKINF
jgi:hypothetical protein